MTLLESIASWKRERNESAATGWQLLRQQLIDGEVDPDGKAAAESLGFTADDLPELEQRIKQRADDRRMLDRKADAVKRLAKVESEIRERNESFAEIQRQYESAIAGLTAEHASLQSAINVADRAALRLKETSWDPTIAERETAINKQLKSLADQRKPIAAELKESEPGSSAQRLLLAKRELERAAYEDRDLDHYERIIEQCQKKVADQRKRLQPIDDEIAKLHREADELDRQKLEP